MSSWRTERVVQIEYDPVEGRRFRHIDRLRRGGPDRDPLSCTDDQLDVPVRYGLAGLSDAGPEDVRP